ncbi:MAG: prolyl oligopeptidase family protein [Phenylobacterium sp.]|nr:prolyl oligopeptidase family protein [Phenylobacterium sp.]
MACIRRFWLGIVFALLAGPALAAPLEAYGKLPSIEDASVSATGGVIALVVTNGEERRLVVKDMAKNQTLFLGGLGHAKVRDIRWAGDDHLILTSSVTGVPLGVEADRAEWYMAADVNIATKKVKPLLTDAGESMNAIDGLPIVRVVDGRPALFLQGIHFVDSQGVLALFRIDLKNDSSKLVETGDIHTRDFLVGPDGRAVAQTLYESRSGKWSLKLKGDGWRTVMTRDEPIDPPDVMGLGRDGRSIVLNMSGKDGAGWYEVDGATAGVGPLMPALDGQTTLHDPTTGRLIGHTELVGDESRYVFYDPADQKVWAAVAKAFPDNRVSLVSWSNDRSKIIVRADSPTLGPAYVYVDMTARAAKILGNEYLGVGPDDVSPTRAVRYKAADGFELSGYLTLPRGRDPKNLPLVVFPHGGPAARDEPGFDWWAQGMASRGYAVLQVNFRGSSGFGWDYMEAGFGQWGRKMQTDLSDGVRHLAAQGTIDPKRVCIVGASYGGYAALAGAALDKGVYRCAVSFGGVSDLKRMVGYSNHREGRGALRYWTRYMGAKDLGDPVLAQYSPALQAAAADIPVLLIHGRDDTVVPLSQSIEMADALKRAGKSVELVVQPHADHWLSLGDTRFQTLQATVAFLEKNNPPQ